MNMSQIIGWIGLVSLVILVIGILLMVLGGLSCANMVEELGEIILTGLMAIVVAGCLIAMFVVVWTICIGMITS